MNEMSIDNIRITADSCNVDFKQAKRLAEEVILGMVRAPRLIAWFDYKKDQRRRLRETDKRVLLSESDSGIRVDINNDEYSFIFTETE